MENLREGRPAFRGISGKASAEAWWPTNPQDPNAKRSPRLT